MRYAWNCEVNYKNQIAANKISQDVQSSLQPSYENCSTDEKISKISSHKMAKKPPLASVLKKNSAKFYKYFFSQFFLKFIGECYRGGSSEITV